MYFFFFFKQIATSYMAILKETFYQLLPQYFFNLLLSKHPILSRSHIHFSAFNGKDMQIEK